MIATFVGHVGTFRRSTIIGQARYQPFFTIASSSWCSSQRSSALQRLAGIRLHFASTRAAHLEHEQAKAELKSLMPENAKEAIAHGIRAKRPKSGAISFDLLNVEGGHAAVR
jgi:hypothetical protein